METADSRKGWGQLVPNSFQGGFFISGDEPSPLLCMLILESAVRSWMRLKEHVWFFVLSYFCHARPELQHPLRRNVAAELSAAA